MSTVQNRPSLLRNSRGQGLTEYLVLILLIAIASIAASQRLGKTIKNKIELAERHVKKDISLEDSDDNGGGGSNLTDQIGRSAADAIGGKIGEILH